MQTTTRSPDYVRRAAKSRSDFATAKNIGLKYLRSAQKSSDGSAPVNVRLNRGTLNVNGDYEPSADGGQNGSSRENSALNKANGEAVSE